MMETEILINGISFKQWEETAEARATYQNRDTDRSIYQFPCGTTIINNICMPSNWLKKSWEEAICEWCVPMSKENKELVERYGGKMEKAPYCEDGIGGFVFYSDKVEAMERAWKFVSEQRQNIIGVIA